jgi:hypothetical protein
MLLAPTLGASVFIEESAVEWRVLTVIMVLFIVGVIAVELTLAWIERKLEKHAIYMSMLEKVYREVRVLIV